MEISSQTVKQNTAICCENQQYLTITLKSPNPSCVFSLQPPLLRGKRVMPCPASQQCRFTDMYGFFWLLRSSSLRLGQRSLKIRNRPVVQAFVHLSPIKVAKIFCHISFWAVKGGRMVVNMLLLIEIATGISR